MTDPYPERRRRSRLDRTDHREAARDLRRGRRGPSTQRVKDALDAVASHDVPGTPSVGELKVLKHVHDSEWTVENRHVRSFSITKGDPQHGEYRSDDHVGAYELVVPFEEIDRETVPGHECPECGNWKALYKYRATHFIAGSESIFCLRCEAKVWGEEWG